MAFLEGSPIEDEPELHIPGFFPEAVDIQLHKFRSAHARIVTPGQSIDQRNPHFITAADAITALREMTHDTNYRETSPVECEILRGIILSLEVMFCSLSTRYLLS